MKSTLTFHDNIFLEEDWDDSLFTFNTIPDSVHDPNAKYLTSQIKTGGSDGTFFRQTIHEWGSQTNTKNSYISVKHLNKHVRVNPSEYGGISKIDMSFELMCICNSEVMYALLCEQDGLLFIGSTVVVNTPFQWKKFSKKNLKSDDFTCISKENVKLDLSSNGSEIRFGYTTMNCTKNKQAQTISGIDNWKIIVHVCRAYKVYFYLKLFDWLRIKKKWIKYVN